MTKKKWLTPARRRSIYILVPVIFTMLQTYKVVDHAELWTQLVQGILVVLGFGVAVAHTDKQPAVVVAPEVGADVSEVGNDVLVEVPAAPQEPAEAPETATETTEEKQDDQLEGAP